MEPPSQDPRPRGFDPDSTDTLPLPVLKEEDTGTLAALAPEVAPVRARPRMRVRDVEAPSHTRTDTFQARSLAPIAARPVATSDLAATLREQEQRLQQALERIAELQAQLQAANGRCEELERECATLRAASPETAAVSQAAAALGPDPAHEPDAAQASVPIPAVAAVHDPRLNAIRRQNERLHEALTSMEARIGVHAALLAEAEAALHATRGARTDVRSPDGAAAQDSTRDAAALRIDWQARFTELETVLEAERAAAATRAREHDDQLAALQARLAAAGGAPAASTAAGAPPGAVMAASVPSRPLPIGTTLRVLVREEDGTEVVYPLGRHTTIGRTPDNDIQVNTTFVSRHHAVLLTSSEHCIIEDLNSTNGIVVNGQRVGRQLLHDGDVVTVGKTHFRYQQRT